MKKYDIPWNTGSMFICNKCGISFDQPDMADKLKTDLRQHLKDTEEHKKIRVMVTGCLSICKKSEQAIMYQPVAGKTEIFTVGKNFKDNLAELKSILKNLLK